MRLGSIREGNQDIAAVSLDTTTEVCLKMGDESMKGKGGFFLIFYFSRLG